MREVLGGLLVAEVLEGVGPEEVAHRAEGGGLLEAVQLHKHSASEKRPRQFFIHFKEIVIEAKLMETRLNETLSKFKTPF